MKLTSKRGESQPAGARHDAAPMAFLTLSADGSADVADQRSISRRSLTTFVAVLVALATPLFWATATGSADETPKAVGTKQLAMSADDDGDGDGDGDDDSDSASRSADGSAQTTGGNTASQSRTGRDTRGNTDRGGQNTGKSTRGETDGRDGTGKTERTQGTGRETRGAHTDRPNLKTGVSTRGETDGRDGTGRTERR